MLLWRFLLCRSAEPDVVIFGDGFVDLLDGDAAFFVGAVVAEGGLGQFDVDQAALEQAHSLDAW